MIETIPESVDTIAEVLSVRLSAAALANIIASSLGDDVACIRDVFLVDKLSPIQSARCLIAIHGRNLLTNREIRLAIAESSFPDDLRHAFREAHKSLRTLRDVDDFSKTEQAEAVASHSWHPGSAWSRLYCVAFGLPIYLSGEKNYVTVAATERIAPYIPLNDLHDFQIDLSSKILRLLHADKTARALVALPTGAGKTRLMVETLLGIPEVENGTRSVVWVAQHNELCEQAVQCFAQVWASRRRPGNRRLSIQRVWRGQTEELDWAADVFIGTPESLLNRLSASSRTELEGVLATVIDEAHHAVGPSYAPIFAALSGGAIFGITATPGSSEITGSTKLGHRFKDTILVADELGDSPVRRLQEKGFLAVPEPEEIKTSVRVTAADLENQSVGTFGDLSSGALKRLGFNSQRNQLIINRLLKVDESSSVLCFAPSVRSARAIAAALAMAGRSARSLDSESDIHYRNESVEDFKSARVQFLINYGVLSTGFDAPRVDCLVMARPTLSPVLYEQMLGRGLRGPLNGGTQTCTIIHFEDDFSSFGGIKPMSYGRFLESMGS